MNKKEIKHWFTIKLMFDKGLDKSYIDTRYLCNKVCSITKSKLAETPYSVTCKNCMKKLKPYLGR